MKAHVVNFAFVLAVCGFAATSQTAIAANLIKNASFESATTQTFFPFANASEIGGFDLVGSADGSVSAAGVTDWLSTSRTWRLGDDDISGTVGVTGMAPDGDWVVEIDASAVGGVDVLAQSGLGLTAGTEYTLTFDMWSNTSIDPSAGLDVRLTDGVALDHTSGSDVIGVLSGKTTDGTDGFVETVSVMFTPTVTDTYTLQFFIPMDGGGNHLYIDNLSLTASVPEPSAFILAVLGMVGFSMALRRRNRL